MKKLILGLSLFSFFAIACGDASHDHGDGTHTHEDGSTHTDHDTTTYHQEEFDAVNDSTSSHTHEDGSSHTH